MPYGGTGANKAPMGPLNPILLGQKKESGSGQSLLSQHLSKKKDDGLTSRQMPGITVLSKHKVITLLVECCIPTFWTRLVLKTNEITLIEGFIPEFEQHFQLSIILMILISTFSFVEK